MFKNGLLCLVALTLLSACSQKAEIDYDLLADKVAERLQNTPDEKQERGILNPANGHRYELVNITTIWSEARVYAENRGGYLATVTSQEELDWVYQTFPQARFWLGGTDEASEGNWQWITGEEWDYTNWGKNEPNDLLLEGEDALDMTTLLDKSYGLWNDMPMNFLGFVTSILVEYDAGSN